MIFRYILCFVLLAVATPLYADIICEGSGCSSFIDNERVFLNSFEREYLKEFSKDTMVAQAMTNFSPVPEAVNLKTFTFGLGANFGYTAKSKVLVLSDSKSIEYEMRGYALRPFLYAGINTGYLINSIYNMYLDSVDCEDYEMLKERGIECKHNYEVPFLSQIVFYAYGIKNGPDPEPNVYYRANQFALEKSSYIHMKGYMMRLNVFDQEEVFSDFIKFNGLSFGLGVSESSQNFNLLIKEDKYLYFYDNAFEWSAKSRAIVNSNIKTGYIDFRSGFSFWFLNLYFGAGISSNDGDTNMHIKRNGLYNFNGNNAVYDIYLNNGYRDSFRMYHYIYGLNIGGFTIHANTTTDNNPVTDKYAWSIGIFFSIKF